MADVFAFSLYASLIINYLDLKPKIDRLQTARYYQSLLDSGKFESRAALARYLGVSRARVAQVLNRLIKANVSATEIGPFGAPPDHDVG